MHSTKSPFAQELPHNKLINQIIGSIGNLRDTLLPQRAGRRLGTRGLFCALSRRGVDIGDIEEGLRFVHGLFFDVVGQVG